MDDHELILPANICDQIRAFKEGGALHKQKYNDKPLFRSGHEACRFAYAYSSQQYAMTAMAKLMKGSGTGSGRGLFGLDGAAVAGTIKRHVETLDDQYHAAILARNELVRNNAVVGANAMVQFVMPALGTGAHNRRMVLALTCLYFRIPDENGKPYQLSNLCDQFDLSADTMTRRWRSAKGRLREIESRAQTIIDGVLQEAGIVE